MLGREISLVGRETGLGFPRNYFINSRIPVFTIFLWSSCLWHPGAQVLVTMSSFPFQTKARRTLGTMSEDSHQQAIREFLLHQLSFVSGMPELALAEQLIDAETQAFMLEHPTTSSELNPELAQEFPISTRPIAVATTSGLPPTLLLQSRLSPIPEEGTEPETYLFLGCCPIFLDCQRIVRNWIRMQGRSILHVLRGE